MSYGALPPSPPMGLARLVSTRARDAVGQCDKHKRQDWTDRECALVAAYLEHNNNDPKASQPSSHEAWRLSKPRLDALARTVRAYPSYQAAAAASADTVWPPIEQVKAVYVLYGGHLSKSYKRALKGAKLEAMMDGDNIRVYDKWWIGAISDNDAYAALMVSVVEGAGSVLECGIGIRKRTSAPPSTSPSPSPSREEDKNSKYDDIEALKADVERLETTTEQQQALMDLQAQVTDMLIGAVRALRDEIRLRACPCAHARARADAAEDEDLEKKTLEVNIMEMQLLSLLDWDLRISQEDLYRELDHFLSPLRDEIRTRRARLTGKIQRQREEEEEEDPCDNTEGGCDNPIIMD
ncbi:hypothetical protein B0T24DRAFT_723903 [Lasiosphaeria ovina]|uniref:Uncharacterized protein n=1 Tax=Lasiosphaeria ovina TaxID=92902 RepID=A0AAE0JUZ8_9PEZI|nr:hypothetical protein B0T24DRAFT_723903 [Lasiosphaeria ovina]